MTSSGGQTPLPPPLEEGSKVNWQVVPHPPQLLPLKEVAASDLDLGKQGTWGSKAKLPWVRIRCLVRVKQLFHLNNLALRYSSQPSHHANDWILSWRK